MDMPIHLSCGARNAIAFVFSCPGQREQEEHRPAAGSTGRNLEEVLRIIRGYNYGVSSLEHNDWTRENIWITNAWSRVEYSNCTGRREATIREILCDDNIERLANELKDIEHIIVCCGYRAKRAVSCLRDKGNLRCTVRIISLRHLSNQALNRWIKNCELDQDEPQQRRLERLRRWARCLYGEITEE